MVVRLPAALALLAALPAFAADTANPVLERHIANIEQGLLPAVTVQGAPPVKRKLSEEMARLGVPGVSIAVIHGGEIEWAKGYGVAYAGGPAITPSTLFQAASISKPVTAMAALKLVEDGKLALDRDVNSYTTFWKLPKDIDNSPVTLRQLLSHTGGTTVSGFAGYAAGKPVPQLVQILNGAAPANSRGVHVSTRPGSAWRYSGGGYTVVQYVMTQKSPEGFAALMDSTVLKPIGMADSSFEQPLSPARLARAALPHDRRGKPVAGGPHTYPELAAAGLWTTPSDVARFAIELRRSAAGQANHVLSQTMANLMLNPVLDDFSLGLRMAGEGQAQTFSHGGSNEGYRNRLIAYTERGDGLVIMSNGERGSELIHQLVAAIAAEYNWPTHRSRERRAVALDASAIQQLPGQYQLGANEFQIARSGEGLTIAVGQSDPETLYSAGNGAYFLSSQDLELRFDSSNSGRALIGATTTAFTRLK
ncbi:serine hydrolase [Massilia sp. YIM B04103]|uniref:serine hydrolase domain-containing protein n=1 Tax=Massilia sp. YIM B04103 TaxID=2963106 RepID=UPI00210BD5EA|nr:serine hydrolase domain-containing protein [Massilia sp. YIM B04103]